MSPALGRLTNNHRAVPVRLSDRDTTPVGQAQASIISYLIDEYATQVIVENRLKMSTPPLSYVPQAVRREYIAFYGIRD